MHISGQLETMPQAQKEHANSTQKSNRNTLSKITNFKKEKNNSKTFLQMIILLKIFSLSLQFNAIFH